MNTTSYEINSSPGITHMPEAIVESKSDQPLLTTNDIDIINEENHLLEDQDNLLQNEINITELESTLSRSSMPKKQESLISVYDNSNNGEQYQKQEISQNSSSIIGILGRSQRAQAFAKRLLLSDFPKPILCDTKSMDFNVNEKSDYVSSEAFCEQSPSIIIITDELMNNIDDFINHDKQQLIIDARESITKYLSYKSVHSIKLIPRSYRAFGNLSNWEIENGTQRVGVAVEQGSPLSVIKFIHDLNCFPRRIIFLDQYSYNYEQSKSFRHCLFPLVATLIIFTLCFILSMFENKRMNSYTQASSVTGTTSLTLLALLFLIRPILESIDFIYLYILRKQHKKNIAPHLKFMQRWLQSRRYLAWYSLTFALLHLLFLLFSKENFHQEIGFYPTVFGLFTFLLLSILSFVYFPWISERLLWREYHLLTAYLGPFCLLIGFIHVLINWQYEYYHSYRVRLFSLKFFSIFLPFIVLSLTFIIYVIIRPTIKLIQWKKTRPRQSKPSTITKKDTALLP